MSNPTELPDLDKLEALARVDRSSGLMSITPAAVLALIQLARRAQPEAEAPLYAELPEHLRQFQHNDCSGLVFGYDKKGIDRMMARLLASRPSATLSPLCGAQHAESGKEAAVQNQELVIARLEQIAECDSVTDMVEMAQQALVCARAVLSALAAQQAAAPKGEPE